MSVLQGEDRFGTDRERPDLTVIIVTHNRAGLALATIRSAREALGDITAQWLVVDSGSADDTPERIEEEFPDIEVERCPNIGFAAANNRAITRARGRYALFLNPDVEVEYGTFAALLEKLDEHPRIGLASVTQLNDDGGLEYSIRRDPSVARTIAEALCLPRVPGLRSSGELELNDMRYRTACEADWVVGALMVVRAEALDVVGPFDERFFLYSEETDWCYRFRQAGWSVSHLPVMAVTHHRSTTYSPDLLAQLSYAKTLFARKHYGTVRAAGIRAALVFRHLVRRVAAGIGSDTAVPSRTEAEARALAVVSGRQPPPFVPRSEPRAETTGSAVM
jgi:N-acetylglucosaminyl-diphospho-decaprenol L-rhamnosyltransferase